MQHCGRRRDASAPKKSRALVRCCECWDRRRVCSQNHASRRKIVKMGTISLALPPNSLLYKCNVANQYPFWARSRILSRFLETPFFVASGGTLNSRGWRVPFCHKTFNKRHFPAILFGRVQRAAVISVLGRPFPSTSMPRLSTFPRMCPAITYPRRS